MASISGRTQTIPGAVAGLHSWRHLEKDSGVGLPGLAKRGPPRPVM